MARNARNLYSFTNTIKFRLDRESWKNVKRQSETWARQLARDADPQNATLNAPVRRRRQPDQADSHIKHYRSLQREQAKFEAKQKQVLKRFVLSNNEIRQMSALEKKLLLDKLKQAKTTTELLHLERQLKTQITDRNRKEKSRTRELAKQAALITHQNNERRKAAASSLKNAGMAAGLAVGSLAALGMQQSLQKANELDKAIKKSGLDATTFQNIAAAGEKYGLSMDSLADQYKDFSDKLGDYQLTSGGEFKDVAEWLKQNTKISEEMLKGLKPLEAMKLIQEEAKRRGTDMNQLTFLMESFGNDAILQFKALANIEEIRAQRERFNLNLTQQDLDTLVKARQNISLIGEGFGRLMDSFLAGFGNGDINSVMSDLKDLQPTFRQMGESVRSFTEILVKNGDEIITIAKVLGSVWVGSKVFTVLRGGASAVTTLTSTFKELSNMSKGVGLLNTGLRSSIGLFGRLLPIVGGLLTVLNAAPNGDWSATSLFGKNKFTQFLDTPISELFTSTTKQIQSNQQKVDVNLNIVSDVNHNGNIVNTIRSEIDQDRENQMVTFYQNVSPSTQ